jgi:hypothetical protein
MSVNLPACESYPEPVIEGYLIMEISIGYYAALPYSSCKHSQVFIDISKLLTYFSVHPLMLGIRRHLHLLVALPRKFFCALSYSAVCRAVTT